MMLNAGDDPHSESFFVGWIHGISTVRVLQEGPRLRAGSDDM